MCAFSQRCNNDRDAILHRVLKARHATNPSDQQSFRDLGARRSSDAVRFSPIGESAARLIVLALAVDVYVLHAPVSSYPFVRLR